MQYPLIAILKFNTGAIYTEHFRHEREFEVYHKLERPDWATLIDKATGHTVIQVSYPNKSLDF